MIPATNWTIHPEVSTALKAGGAVVALESSLLARGTDWEANLETAVALENEVRACGAVPAMCAIIDGMITVGLSTDEKARLAKSHGRAIKASQRDIATLTACGGTGVTTIAATITIAHLAGIRVLSAGGFGGVHRGASQSFDVSNDLHALANTPMTVVCSGIKSILDVGLTLEYLETLGVPVIGYGTDRLPGYYCRETRFSVDARIDEPSQIARVLRASGALGLRGGLLVCNPIPRHYALPEAELDQAIGQALEEARMDGIEGKAITPYLIARLDELVAGTRQASVQLGLNNSRLASAIAAC